MTLYIGVDWETRRVRAAWSGQTGPVVNVAGCEPTLSAVQQLLDRVRTASEGGEDSSEVRVIIEAGAIHWVKLFHSAGAHVHVVDPKQARRFAESLCSSTAKDDARDAQILVHLGRSEEHCPSGWMPPSRLLGQLEVLEQAHCQALRAHTRCLQQLRQTLRESMPCIEERLKDINANWVVRFLEVVPTAWHLKQMSARRLQTLLCKVRCRTRSKEAIQEAAAQTEVPWLDECTASLQAIQVRSWLKQIALHQQDLNEIEQRLKDLVSAEEDGQRLLAINGIGPKLAAAVLRYGEFDSRDSSAIRMGAAPVFQGSGTKRSGGPKGVTRMRKAAPSQARRAVYLIGRLVTANTPWAQAMYNDGIRRGQRHATIYRRVARSMLRIIHAVLRDKSTYDPNLYLLALKNKGVPWALCLPQ